MTEPGNNGASDGIMTLRQTGRAQADAADPLASVWLSANAGTGKTHVLTMRVMRLLLAGTPPERILCLTYTKAAAAEMSKRVFDKLAKWVTMGEAELQTSLAELLERDPQDAETARARQLFALSIETPGGLKVQTIHAFCERLLQRFPLEAGVPPHFTILDDETARTLERTAIDDVLTQAARDPQSALACALDTAIAFAADDAFDDLMRSVLGKREWLSFMVRRDTGPARGGSGGGDDPLQQAEADYRQMLGLAPDLTTAGINAEMAIVLSADQMQRAVSVLQQGKKTDQTLASSLGIAARAQTDSAKVDALRSAFLKQDGLARADSRFITKAIREAEPGIADQVIAAKDAFADLAQQLNAMKLVDATMALARLGNAVMQRYSEAKARRAALDYDDLLVGTSNLLSMSHSTQWVLYKLDGGLDHILVDEAQDTSPIQWSIIQALAAEFFAGSGGREDIRTLFAVGDEKQSIYGFQGAAPKMFAQMGANFAKMADAADLLWRRIPLTMSFRTVEPVLSAVDLVFADKEKVPGLSTSDDAIRHNVFRQGHAGFVEIWPPETHDEVEPGDVWSPLHEETASDPVPRLANKIADTIKGWLDNGEILKSGDRPLRAGDIIILLRKRAPFAEPMVKALKARGIPVAGTDRLILTQQIAVLDFMSLGDFMVLPEDDLALANVLKSPLFNLTDDHLLELVVAGKGSMLWSSLLAQAKTNPVFVEAAETLKSWRARADHIPPYEFFAALLDHDGGRVKMLNRLGSEAADPIDEFLQLALTYDDGAPPSLQGFLDWLRQINRQIKRDMEFGRDEVRVMTVHGAKGLEAPVVFLPDTCSTKTGGMGTGLLDFSVVALPTGDTSPAPMVWPVKGTAKLDAVVMAKQAIAELDAQERHRLLYVAMTRARDRLYVAGFEGKSGRATGCWYDLIENGLSGVTQNVTLGDGSEVSRYSVEQTAATELGGEDIASALEASPPPDWARRDAPIESSATIPLAPSQLAPLESDDTGEPIEQDGQSDGDGTDDRDPPTPSPRAMTRDNRFARGILSHALLEYLPQLPTNTWDQAAIAFVEKRGMGLAPRTRASIAGEVLAVLRSPDFAPLFGPGSRAEVPISAEISAPDQMKPSKTGTSSGTAAPVLKVTGQIDRLVVLGDDVMIVDYKTNRPPPHDPGKVATSYLLQLAAYRLAVAQAFPEKTIRAAILWTDGVRIMEIPTKLLDFHENRLWRPKNLKRAALDG